jgi:protein-L-isoaspartate(D-aspartate) O-methyltransferase
MADDLAVARDRMVDRIRAVTGVSPPVLEAFRRVPRHRFVPDTRSGQAYEDRALPLAEGQTISQPSMIAIMLEALALEPYHRVLEVGAGSGYAAALLSVLAGEVDAIEIRPALAADARRTLSEIGVRNVHVRVGDGRRGLPERAPFDRILVSAGAGSVPPALVNQLATGGRIAIPIGSEWGQTLMIGEKDARGDTTWKENVGCAFVPLVAGTRD